MKSDLRTMVVVIAAALSFALAGCSDDSGSKSDTVGQINDLLDGNPDGGGSGLTLPAKATLEGGIGGTVVSAHLCQTAAIGGGIFFSLSPSSASPCLGGEKYLTFVMDTANSEYSVVAGKIFKGVGQATEPVKITSTSEGTVAQNLDGDDEIKKLTEKTDITIATAGHSKVTFSFEAKEVTLKTFE